MSARGFLVLWIIMAQACFWGLVFHLLIDVPPGYEFLLLLHVSNIVFGAVNIGRTIAIGQAEGWKS